MEGECALLRQGTGHRPRATVTVPVASDLMNGGAYLRCSAWLVASLYAVHTLACTATFLLDTLALTTRCHPPPPVTYAAWYWPSPLSTLVCTATFVIASLTDWLDGYLARKLVRLRADEKGNSTMICLKA